MFKLYAMPSRIVKESILCVIDEAGPPGMPMSAVATAIRPLADLEAIAAMVNSLVENGYLDKVGDLLCATEITRIKMDIRRGNKRQVLH
jgi:hypothetical protein